LRAPRINGDRGAGTSTSKPERCNHQGVKS
jgi:hypothetical protein